MNVFAIIVTYKGQQWYDRCFSSLRRSTIPIEIVVVDNASNDGTVEYLKNKYPEIHIIESSFNLGFGQANNKGIRYSLDHGCDYVFLLNQDAWIEPDSIRLLIDVHLQHKEYGVLSPIHLTPDRNHIEKGALIYADDFRTTDRTLFEDMYFNRMYDVYNTSYINAAAWLIPREILNTVGGFDPIFFHYGEDDNYMRRVIYHGFKIGICPLSKIVHDCDNKGVRAYSEEELERRRLLPLLIRFTDITKEDSVSAYIRYLNRKKIFALINGEMKVFHERKNDVELLRKSKRAIVLSRESNTKKGETWL